MLNADEIIDFCRTEGGKLQDDQPYVSSDAFIGRLQLPFLLVSLYWGPFLS